MEYDYFEHEVQDVLNYIEDEINLNDWIGRRSELEA